MLGDDTLWLPGVDHAAIAVNAIIERDLPREGISRHDIGREAFLERTWEFVHRSRDRIGRAAPPPGRLRGLEPRGVHDGRAARASPSARPSSASTTTA
jgi:hypothetical protein